MINESISNRLKNHMASKDISGVELAMRSDVKPSFIYDVLSGKSTNPSTIKLARVAGALGISIAELVEPTAAPDTEYIAIPLLHIEHGGGEIEVASLPPRGEPYYFRRSWIKERLNTQPENLRMTFIRGDCMAPTLHPNDLTLIDITSTSPSPPGVFTLFDGFGLITKRLEYVTGKPPLTLRILSDNPQYAPYTTPAEHVKVIGRVVWFSREI